MVSAAIETAIKIEREIGTELSSASHTKTEQKTPIYRQAYPGEETYNLYGSSSKSRRTSLILANPLVFLNLLTIKNNFVV